MSNFFGLPNGFGSKYRRPTDYENTEDVENHHRMAEQADVAARKVGLKPGVLRSIILEGFDDNIDGLKQAIRTGEVLRWRNIGKLAVSQLCALLGMKQIIRKRTFKCPHCHKMVMGTGYKIEKIPDGYEVLPLK